jgi:trans-aconitate methyltransferase
MNKILLSIFVGTSLCYAMEEENKQEWDAQYYQKNSSPQFHNAVQLLKTLKLSQCTDIIDIGCGPGEVTKVISKMVPHAQVLGVDVTEKMIARANETHKADNLRFMVHDAQKEYPFENRFDLAFSSAVFLWIPDKKAAFDNIHKILKPKGTMVIKTNQPRANNHPLNCAMMQLAKKPKWFSFVKEYQSKPQTYPLSLEIAKQLITSDKWDSISLEEPDIVNTYKSKQEFSTWMLAVMKAMPAVATLAPKQQEELAEEFAEEYVNVPGIKDENGIITYKLPGLLIKAQKK